MMLNSQLQYLVDEAGEKTAVIIPIDEWNTLQKRLKKLDEYATMEADLTQAMKEVGAIKSGELEEQTLEDFLNEC